MVVTTIDRDTDLDLAADEPRRLDLHAWIAIAVAVAVAAGTLTMSGIALAHVP